MVSKSLENRDSINLTGQSESGTATHESRKHEEHDNIEDAGLVDVTTPGVMQPADVQRSPQMVGAEALPMQAMGNPIGSAMPSHNPEPTLQMSVEESEEEIRMKPAGMSFSLGAGSDDENPSQVPSRLESNIRSTKGSGEPLPQDLAEDMGSKMGEDFSDVKVHTDANAISANDQLGARAFTQGNDIYFNRGEYDASSQNGKHLLAHELTHVVQQKSKPDFLSKAQFSVGNQTIQVNYGEVIGYNSVNKIQELFTVWNGSALAQPILDQIRPLSDSQRQWILFGLDLLMDNPQPALVKEQAIQRLINHAPQAVYAPLGGSTTYEYEEEVLRVSGWFEITFTSGLTAPSASRAGLYARTFYNRGTASSTSTAACPAPRQPSAQLDEPVMRAQLPPLVRSYLSTRAANVSGANISSGNIADVGSVADIIQAEALNFFSPYMGRGRTRDYLTTWQYSAHLQASTAPGAIDADVRAAFIANRADQQASRAGLWSTVNFDPRCSADQLVFESIMQQLLTEAQVIADLNAILSWQSFTEHRSSSAEVTINLQYNNQNTGECEARWKHIATLCHELVHVYIDDRFFRIRAGRKILSEGFTEILGNQLYDDIRQRASGNANYRSTFEVGLSPNACNGVSIPPSTRGYQPDSNNAERVRQLEGDDNFRAAYFMGRIDLVGLQPKLKVGQPGDKYEQEADTVADRIMRMEDQEEEIHLQQKADASSRFGSSITDVKQAPSQLESDITGMKGGGEPLPNEVADDMGQKMGADFSGVKIHRDANAQEASQQLGAKAFTSGQHIFFNQGQYNSESHEGRRLLGHELTHVVQQQGAAGGMVQRDTYEEFRRAHPELAERALGLAREYEQLVSDTDNLFEITGIYRLSVPLMVRLRGNPVNLRHANRQETTQRNRAMALGRRIVSENLFDTQHMYRWLGHVHLALMTLRAIMEALQTIRLDQSQRIVTDTLLQQVNRQLRTASQLLGRGEVVSAGRALAQQRRTEAATERRRQAVPNAIRYMRRYYRRHRSNIQALAGPGAGAGVHATVVANKLVHDLELDSTRVRRVLERVRSGNAEMFHHLLFHNRLISELGNRGITGLEGFREEFEGTFYSMVDGLMGEFNEDPDLVAIGTDTTISLIPVLDQISDARDIIAHIYFLSDRQRNELTNPLRWLGLVFTLIGIVPEAGSAIKGLSKILMRGARRHARRVVTRVTGRALNLIERLFPRALDGITVLFDLVRRRWADFVSTGGRIWTRVMEQGGTVLRRIMDISTQRWNRIRQIANRMMPPQFERARVFITELIEAVGDALRRRGAQVSEVASNAFTATLSLARRVRDRIRRLSATGRLQMADEAYEQSIQRLDDLEQRLFAAMSDGNEEVAQQLTREMDEVSNALDQRLARIEGTTPRSASTIEGADAVADESGRVARTGERAFSNVDVQEIQANLQNMRRSTEPGYVVEVPVGDHVWRRRLDGRWCRFTDPTCVIVPDFNEMVDDAIEQSGRRSMFEEMLDEAGEQWETNRLIETAIGRQLVRDIRSIGDDFAAELGSHPELAQRLDDLRRMRGFESVDDAMNAARDLRNRLQDIARAGDGATSEAADARRLFTDEEIDEFVSGFDELAESPRVTGGQRPRVDGRRVPTRQRRRLDIEDIPLQADEVGDRARRMAVARIRQVIGHTLMENPAVRAAWEAAKSRTLSRHQLIASNYETLYNTTRGRFWLEVRRSPEARRYFEEAGFIFSGGERSAPLLGGVASSIRRTEIRISLDHIREKAIGNNWQYALDADNLQMEFAMPNTYREIIQSRHPDLRVEGD
ncbi:MAG: DUF4157 domain-containing protein [Bacteroidota bacterium]